jgi:hypothetical protein
VHAIKGMCSYFYPCGLNPSSKQAVLNQGDADDRTVNFK